MESFQAPLNTPPPKRHPFPGNQLLHVTHLSGDSNDTEDHPDDVRTPVTDLDQAAVVSSKMADPLFVFPGEEIELHRPVLDVDLSMHIIPSSTPGHGHLYIDKPMTWAVYERLLDALAAAGIVEQGYVNVSKERGFTAVRVPWVRKGDALPELVGEDVAVAS
jgi:hypothetical protein